MSAVVCSKRSSDFVAIQVASIPAIPRFDRTLYLQSSSGPEFRLYRDAGAELKASDLARLVDAGITTVYLDGGDYGRFQEELRSSLDAIVADERVPVSQRFSVVNEVVRGVLRESFRRGNIDHTVKETSALSEHVVDLVCRDDDILSELNSVLHFDYSTFTHSANVAYYTLILASALGITDRAVLRKIGIGALLHDIGKLGIPEKILLKPGRLAPEEWNVLRSHPAKGLMALREQEQLEFGQLMMVYQHHERVDGTGYPVRLVGDEIHEWARICAVADVYEALTSNRPYRQALSAVEAFGVIEKGEGSGLEPEFLQCWKQTITQS
jgi:HD-GYP domain-containing protein (c-di-GMP phosphodiesterase class II)